MKKDARFVSVVILIFLLPAVSSLFAFGRRDATADTGPVNTEWTLCVTALDVSALPVARHITGETVVKRLGSSLASVDFRVRGEEEASYYRNVAWAKSRADAAKALQAKRNERDQLVYRGDPSWRYRKNSKTVDDAIAKLEEDMARVDTQAPVVEGKPVFRVTDGNKNGVYPRPPAEGGEYRFCVDQKADAFLTGDLSEYHGRIFLHIRMYTLYTRSFSYEDFILFSSEDLNSATDEISMRLVSAVSETLPSAILVSATPGEAMVSIDGAFAGRGDMEMYTHSPGAAEITVQADNYLPFSFHLDLDEGELAELYIDLTPLGSAAFEAGVPGNPGSKVFVGSLFVGETPLTLQLPKYQYSYISVETPSGETGSVVYRDNDLVRGSAQFVRSDFTGGGSAAFNTKVPVSPEEKRVDRARRGFYGAYGAFWVILPIALLTVGITGNYINANNQSIADGTYDGDYNMQKKIHDSATMARTVQIGATVSWTAALGVTFFQIFRYLYVSGGDSTPIVKVQEKKASESEAASSGAGTKP